MGVPRSKRVCEHINSSFIYLDIIARFNYDIFKGISQEEPLDNPKKMAGKQDTYTNFTSC